MGGGGVTARMASGCQVPPGGSDQPGRHGEEGDRWGAVNPEGLGPGRGEGEGSPRGEGGAPGPQIGGERLSVTVGAPPEVSLRAALRVFLCPRVC